MSISVKILIDVLAVDFAETLLICGPILITHLNHIVYFSQAHLVYSISLYLQQQQDFFGGKLSLKLLKCNNTHVKITYNYDDNSVNIIWIFF